MRLQNAQPDPMPNLFIIAGPNGAGKTTYELRFLPEEMRTREFVNADLIAAGLSPFAPGNAAFEAGRIMLARLRDSVTARRNRPSEWRSTSS